MLVTATNTPLLEWAFRITTQLAICPITNEQLYKLLFEMDCPLPTQSTMEGKHRLPQFGTWIRKNLTHAEAEYLWLRLRFQVVDDEHKKIFALG